jgi:peptide/nickel transport system substrate-binding protein
MAIVMLGAVVGCGDPGNRSTQAPAVGAGTTATPKRLTASLMGDPATVFEKFVTPGSGQAPGASHLNDLYHTGLAQAVPDQGLVPRLAEVVPTIENGGWTMTPDGQMVMTWTIRPGAAWHDGTPFTAEDLVFSAKLEQDPELPVDKDFIFEHVDRIEALDARTIRVSWSTPYVFADMLFTTQRGIPLPKHILERLYAEDKVHFAEWPYWREAFVGTGPFKIRDWVRGSHLVLEANDRYVLGRPKLDLIEVRFIQDANAVVANVLAGVVELTIGASMTLEQNLDVADQWGGGRVDIWFNNVVSAWPQLLNPSPAVIADVRFRRALLHATDRQSMVDTLLHGKSEVAESLVNPKYPENADVSSAIVRYPYDPRRAGEIIESLGYTRGSDGFFRDGAGQKLAVEIRGSTVTEIGRKVSFPLADDWQRAGVTVDLLFPPPQRSRDREYRATFPGFEVARGANEFEGLRRFHSSNNAVPENNFAGTNRTRYVNREFDALIESFYVTIPRAQRIEILRAFIHHMTDNVLILSLFHDAESALVSSRLKNIVGGGGASTQAWNAHEWDVN